MSSFFDDDAIILGKSSVFVLDEEEGKKQVNSFFDDDAEILTGQDTSSSDTLNQEHEAYKSEPKQSFLSFNLRKALLNQGVDPDTMEVVRPVQEMGFFEKVVRSFKGGDARMKMDLRMLEAAESETDIYASVRFEEVIYEQAVKANPIVAESLIERDVFNAAQAWGYCAARGDREAIAGGVVIGIIAALAIIKYFSGKRTVRL